MRLGFAAFPELVRVRMAHVEREEGRLVRGQKQDTPWASPVLSVQCAVSFGGCSS